jgi:hypothetical protein
MRCIGPRNMGAIGLKAVTERDLACCALDRSPVTKQYVGNTVPSGNLAVN